MDGIALRKRKTQQLVVAALAIAAVMFLGFAKNYYLRAWLGTRPISAMVHLHGAVMTTWVVLFITQTGLIAKGRVDLHRKLGVAGALLAAVVLALGLYTITVAIERQRLSLGAPAFINAFIAFDGASLLLFGGLVVVALCTRRRPPTHKRLMLMAMVSLLPPAFGRFVAYFTRTDIEMNVLILMYSGVALCLLIDTVRQRRVNLSLIWSGGLIVAVNQLTYFAQVAD